MDIRIDRLVHFEQPELSDTEEIQSIIFRCFNKFVGKFYDLPVLDGLKSIYSLSNIKHLMDDPNYEVWVARRLNQMNWVFALKDSPEEDGIELKMFYGTSPYSCKKSLYLAKDRVLEKNRSYLFGDVLESAWHTFSKCGCVGDLKVSEEYIRTETNQKSFEEFDIRVRNFRFKPLEVLLYENSFETD
ncbi:MAG: hypothetical protein WC867_00995 [Candidatus Pacearchaeota archaeon]